jgi:ferritin
MNRTITLLSEDIKNLLLKQMAHELSNYSIYMTFAAFYSRNGYVNLEKYYRKRAEEEFKHHMWCFDYITEADCEFIYPAISVVPEKYTPQNDLLKPFEWTVEREIETTQMIYAIYEQAVKENDRMTMYWLGKLLINEQIEEENTSRMAQSIAEQEDSWLEKAEEIYELLEN